MSVRSKPNREGEAPAEPERDGSELPEGWANTTVAAVIADCQPGFASGDKNVEDGVSHLRMNNIGLLGELILDLVRTVPEKLAKPQHELQLGDVLVCTTNSAKLVGKCAIFDLEGRYAFSNHLTRLRPNRDAIDSSYLRWCLWSLWKAGAFDDKCKHWVNQSTIPKDALLDASIPLPPLAEQRRIVGKLELLLGKVSSSQQRLSWVPGLLKRFRQSVLAAACSGKLTADWREENDDIESASTLRNRIQSKLGRPLAANEWEEQPLDVPPTWEWIQAEDLCRRSSTITYGILKPVWVAKGVPTVRVQDMKAGSIDVEAVGHCSPERAEKFSKTLLEVGDLLIAKDGATLGKTAFVPPSLAGGNVTQHVLRFPISSSVIPVFVRLVIDSRHGQEWMRMETKGVALPGVNVGDFRRMPIPLPPLAEQQEIVRRVEKLFAFADQIEARLKQAQAHVDRLTQSLLAKAFRGELVPTEHALATAAGRDYEPASALLERIRANKQPSNDKRSRRRST